LDDKSGYDHLLLAEESRTCFGIQWGGWYFLYNTLPFGWNISPFVYHTTALVATDFFRSLGIPCLLYIDDRHNGQLQVDLNCGPYSQLQTLGERNLAAANLAIFLVCYYLVQLGYFLGLSKSILCPAQVVPYLGFLLNSARQASDFEVFNRCQPVGKCVSFSLAVPGALLFTREMNLAISKGMRTHRLIKIDKNLRDEIAHWLFLETWDDPIAWRDERHMQILLPQTCQDPAGEPR